MTNLIDRYVTTALRRVPEKQRADIDRELRASIDDAVDAKLENGEPQEAAIESTLLELGDPVRLADSYADRRQYLIGPELFPIWRRLSLMLFSVVLPIVVAIAVILQLIDDPAIGPAIGTAFATALTTGVHLAFWTTGVFAVLERTGVARTDLRPNWTPADLPKYETGFRSAGQLAGNLLWPVLLIVALVLQQFTFSEVPVLDPGNWSSWWPYFIAVLLLECGYAVWLYRRGAWTHTVTAANAALAVLFAGPAVWLLASHRFFNPEFIGRLDWHTTDPLHWLTLTVLIVVVLGAVWDIVDVAIRTERARRGLPAKAPGTGGFSVRAG
ncbi:permease prefix domain 1-containing protein [Micromonosporaceae bacterium Da 78-11]